MARGRRTTGGDRGAGQSSLRRGLRADGGATAVEMALLAPALLALLIGVIQGGLLIFTQASLHYAVQKAVRCAAISSTCPSEATHYYGLDPSPVFTLTLLACGQALTATTSYDLDVLLYKKSISLTATACFPDIKSTPS